MIGQLSMTLTNTLTQWPQLGFRCAWLPGFMAQRNRHLMRSCCGADNSANWGSRRRPWWWRVDCCDGFIDGQLIKTKKTIKRDATLPALWCGMCPIWAVTTRTMKMKTKTTLMTVTSTSTMQLNDILLMEWKCWKCETGIINNRCV